MITYRSIFVCPDCRSTKVRIRTSRDQGDGSRFEHWECKDCGLRFKCVAEPPDDVAEQFDPTEKELLERCRAERMRPGMG